MSRVNSPVCRSCRREGQKLFLKGDKCFTACVLTKRPTPPGKKNSGFSFKKNSEYHKRLREKQKLKRMVVVSEKQFRNYFDKSVKRKGLTGENLLVYLSLRLDSVLYSLGFSVSRLSCRQMISHGHVLVNNKKVDIPSYIVSVGDVVRLSDDSAKIESFMNNYKNSGRFINVPEWIRRDVDNFAGTVLSMPTKEASSFSVDEQLIVELYSK